METFKLGQVFTITGAVVKANNGTFIVSTVIPQNDLNDYILFRRLDRRGAAVLSESTNNHRSFYMSRVRMLAEAGKLVLGELRTDVVLNPVEVR